MKILDRGTVFASALNSDHQSCAFPQVAVLPGGRWLVGSRAARTKKGKIGQHVQLRFSDDEGKSWSPSATPFVPPILDGKLGQFRALALTALGGSRVLATLYWVDNSDPALPFFNEQTEGLLDSRIMLAESNDAGLTWTTPKVMDNSPFHVPTPMTGPVLLLPDGEWVCQFETNKPYDDTSRWVHTSVLMFSHDEGRTWSRHAVVSFDPRIFYWDQRPQVLPDGRILDVFWTYDNQAATYRNIHARESRDAGRSWSELWDTGVPGQPAPVQPLPDGRLALVTMDRTTVPALKLRTSRDGGHTWPVETELILYEALSKSQTRQKQSMQDTWAEMGDFSVGLPATAMTTKGDLLVVYYAGPTTDETSIEWLRVRMSA